MQASWTGEFLEVKHNWGKSIILIVPFREQPRLHHGDFFQVSCYISNKNLDKSWWQQKE